MVERGDVVLVDFPYIDSDRTEYRPAVVISGDTLHKLGICWVVMVTTAKRSAWKHDIALPKSKATGLDMDSIIRPAKLSTTEISSIDVIGKLPGGTLQKLMKALAALGS